MRNFSIGNKGKIIIRNFSDQQIGGIQMQYIHQPYTVIPSVDIQLNFDQITTNSKSKFSALNYNIDNLDTININSVAITEKILNLIFAEKREILVSTCENVSSGENGEAFLKVFDSVLYNIYIYNKDGNLSKFIEKLEGNKLIDLVPNEDFLIFYEMQKEKGFSLSKNQNFYLTLDIELEGNSDSQTTSQWIHIDKASLSVNKNMNLSNKLSTVDLIFKVLQDSDNYIVLE